MHIIFLSPTLQFTIKEFDKFSNVNESWSTCLYTPKSYTLTDEIGLFFLKNNITYIKLSLV